MGANEELLGRLKAVECADSTASFHDPALVLAQARGSSVFDAEGRELIDLCAGFGVLALGHAAPSLQRTLARYADETGIPPIVHGMGDVYPSDAKVSLIETLLACLPPYFKRAALALTGAQAVEIAVKTAILATGRSGFITFEGGYHGLDLGLLPLTSRADFRAPFRDFLPQGRVATLPFHASRGQLDQAFDSLKDHGGIAAVIVEPVQGRAGIRAAGVHWLDLLRRACDRHGALLIYDEVFTGLGRSGRLTYAEDVPCDLLCLGKALGGGLPLSACVGTGPAMEAWPESSGEALHTGTFFGHPLACAVGRATLEEIVKLGLPARAKQVGTVFRDKLAASLKGHPAVRDVRGEGLMIAIELRADGHGVQLMNRLRQLGVLALVSGERGHCLNLTPPLIIEEAVLDSAHQIIMRALENPPN